MFSLCLNALAVYGRLVVIGMISQVSFQELSYVHPVLYLNDPQIEFKKHWIQYFTLDITRAEPVINPCLGSDDLQRISGDIFLHFFSCF